MHDQRTLKKVHIGSMKKVWEAAPISRHQQLHHHWLLMMHKIRIVEYIDAVLIFTKAPRKTHAFNSKLSVSLN